MVKRSFWILLLCGIACSGCLKATPSEIPGIPKDHSANAFYRFVSQSMVSDKVCRDYKGDPAIPMGEIAKEERYTKTKELAPGVFQFTDEQTEKKYLGVSFQYQGFLQIPKLCAWEEADRG